MKGNKKKRAGAINQIHTERKCGNGRDWEEKRVTPELDSTFSLYCPHCSYLFYVSAHLHSPIFFFFFRPKTGSCRQ